MFPATQHPPGALARLGWQDFEHLLSEHYRDQGYRVEPHASVSTLKAANGALDLRLRRGNESLIVQCKHWDANEVSVRDVNELLGTMLNEAATGGVLVTRGTFSKDAAAVARRQPRLRLVDGDALRTMLKLPGHLDTSVPGGARHAARKTASPRRRASHGQSRVVPVLLVMAVVVLLGVFAWMVISDTHTTSAASSAANPAPTPIPTPTTSTPTPAPLPEPLPPLSGASGIVAKPSPPPGTPPVASREMAERERLRRAAEASRDARARGEDPMKVMERNTREVGQPK